MQNQEFQGPEQQQQNDKHSRRRKRNDKNILAGILLLVAGSLLMTRQVERDLIPHWLFTWPMILIVVGLFVGIQTKFRDIGWVILMGVGAFFLANEVFPDDDAGRFIVPVVVCVVGLILLLSPGRKKHRDKSQDGRFFYNINIGIEDDVDTDKDPVKPKPDVVDATSIFGNVKKVIYSKDFRGGEVVAIFGGVEINLSQADIRGPIVLELVQIFGGTKLIVPPHWQVHSEAVAIFGGIEDKRPTQVNMSPEKVLILRGTALFAGIEIKSY